MLNVGGRSETSNMNTGRLSSLWKRIWDGWQALDEGFHYREGDYLAERVSRLERDVEAIKAATFDNLHRPGSRAWIEPVHIR